MTATDPANAAHAYHASLTSQDSRGTNCARPNASAQPNDPRRLRPVSASTSSAGPSTASGQASAGGKEAYSARPPATEMSRAQRVRNPPKSPARPVRAPEAAAARRAPRQRRQRHRPRRQWDDPERRRGSHVGAVSGRHGQRRVVLLEHAVAVVVVLLGAAARAQRDAARVQRALREGGTAGA